ncbi:DUF3298 and DUF4163 domain-containing protein [Sphingobacterium daejeonense]|uniref:DUF3298 and DUF4163 domain-containing protein n=1 Tax=Sphingobacterium daejeonense TaxID=371142 RepID=UPI0021A58EA8|nr:DUF3298 and DUF4163 domain-containing protein [Sphingobacterium daejeonense]MCT1529797.1 DUF3298 and DUF4163 domain-containing protein [Sphingobacterium daejeonense]
MLVSIFKTTKILFLGTILFIGTASSCQSNKTDGSKTHKQNISPRTDSLSYRDTSIMQISPYFAENDGNADTTYAKITYPIFSDSAMNNIVKANILLDGEPSIEVYLGNFIESYGNFIEENNVKYNLAWDKETIVRVELNSPDLIMLNSSTYEFSGGAHGNSFTIWSVYDVHNYEKLELNTFISENKMKEFTKIAERFFRREEGLADTASLEDEYFFENDEFSLAANYGISKEGIIFYYNSYEIKPYAAGPTYLSIPYEDIQDCMTQTGKNYITKLNEYYNSIQ